MIHAEAMEQLENTVTLVMAAIFQSIVRSVVIQGQCKSLVQRIRLTNGLSIDARFAKIGAVMFVEMI